MKPSAKTTAGLLGVAGLLVAAPALSAGPIASKLNVTHEGHVEYPVFSPDGSKVAYEVNYPAEKKRELWLADYASGQISGTPTKLVPESMATTSRYGGGAKRVTHGFAWASTGQWQYAYGVSDADGTQNIFIDNWSTMIDNGAANKNAAWDPTNPRFVYSSGVTGNGDLYLWDQGMDLQLTFDDKSAELYPAWRPNGKEVAYVSAGGKSGSNIHLLDIDAFSSQTLVAIPGAESTRPGYSPDGSDIVFFSNKDQSDPQQFALFVVRSRPGSEPRPLGGNRSNPVKVRLPSKGNASWTPDGKGVIAVKDDPDAGDPICIFPIDGGAPNCLSSGTRNNRDPRVFVDNGRHRLVFTAQVVEGEDNSDWQKLFTYDLPR